MANTNENRLALLSAAAFAAVAPRNPVVLLPLGSFEDHGIMPMGDYQLAESLAAQIAEACAARDVPCYAAPVLPFGVADYFGASPGGLAISAANFRGVLHDLIAGLLRHRLTRIVILNGHGGNVPVIHEVTLAVKHAGGPIIPSLYLWKLARLMMERRCGETSGRFGHGGEPLMSINFSLRGALAETVRPAKQGMLLGLPVSGFGTLDFGALPVDVPAEFDLAPNANVQGAFANASVALGDAVVAELVAYGAAFAAHIFAQP